MRIQADGEAIKAAREAKGWSQEHLAATAGVSYKTVWAAEKGMSVNRSTLKVIALALGKKLENLGATEVAS